LKTTGSSIPVPHLAPRATANVVLGILARISGLIAGLLLTPIALVALGSQRYGLLAAAASGFEILMLLRGGLGASLRRYVTLHGQAGDQDAARRDYAVGFWWANLAHAAMLLLALALAAGFARFVGVPPEFQEDGARGLGLLALAWTMSQVGSIFEVPIYATGRLQAIQSVSAITPWIRLVAVVLLFGARGPSLTTYAAGAVIAEALAMLALAALAQRSGSVGPALPRFELGDRAIRRTMLAYGGWALVLQAAALITASGPTLLVGRLFGAESVTAYSLGARWEPTMRGLLAVPIAALAPLFTQLEAAGAEERSRAALSRAVGWASALAVPACLVPCVLGDLFLARWVGEAYRSSVHYLWATLAPTTILIAFTPIAAALTGRGRIARLAGGEIVIALAGLGLGWALGRTAGWGPLGFALAAGLAILARSGILIPWTAARDWALAPASGAWRIAAGALLGGLPGLLILVWARPLYGGSLVAVVGASAVGGIAVLLGAVTVSVGWGEVRNLRNALMLAVGGPKPLK
jgi:O-antigen/teichoic acid export membrane protein